MNNRTKVLKYLSGLLVGKEKAEFEVELTGDPDLRQELANIKDHLSDLKSLNAIELPESYLNTYSDRYKLLVRRENSSTFIEKLVYTLGFAVSVVVAVILFKPAVEVNTPFWSSEFNRELAEALNYSEDEYLNDLLYTHDLGMPVDYQNSEMPEKEIRDEELENIYENTIVYLEDNYYSIIDDYNVYSELDENTALELYEKFEDKSFISQGE